MWDTSIVIEVKQFLKYVSYKLSFSLYDFGSLFPIHFNIKFLHIDKRYTFSIDYLPSAP